MQPAYLNQQNLKILAWVGLALMVIGVFLPAQTGYDDWQEGAMVSFDRFDGPNDVRAIRNGLTINAVGFCLLGIVLVTAFSLRAFDGVGVMNFIAWVYISLLFYVVAESEESLGIAWLFLYGGLVLTGVANYMYSQQSAGVPGSPPAGYQPDDRVGPPPG